MNAFPFAVPFVRWADTVRIEAGGAGARQRQIYDHELVYVLDGAGELVLNGQKYDLKPDELFLIKPRVYHSFLSPNEPQRLLGIHFDWEARPDTARFATFRAPGEIVENELFRPARSIENWDTDATPTLDLRGRPRVRRALEEVVTEFNRADDFSQSIAGALLAAAIGQIAREARLLGEVALFRDVSPDAVRRVQRARELLEHPDAPLSVSSIAGTVGWSEDHLRRMCRAVLGASPGEIGRVARVRRAQELLRYGQLPVAEIARRVGFDDASHFARVFKKATGCTPREWGKGGTMECE